MSEPRDEAAIVTSCSTGLAKRESRLVQRGLEDLQKQAVNDLINKYHQFKEHDRSVYVWIHKAQALCKGGQFEEAVGCYDSAIELCSEFEMSVGHGIFPDCKPGIWIGKTNALAGLDRFDDALRLNDEVLKNHPQCKSFWINKGVILARMGQQEDCLECWEKAIEIDPSHENMLSWRNKYTTLVKLKRFDDAIKCCDKMIELGTGPDPELAHFWPWNLKGVFLHSLRRFDEALGCYEKAVALDRDMEDAVIWFNKAQTEEELGRTQNARSSYERYLAFAPKGDEQIKFAQARLLDLQSTTHVTVNDDLLDLI